MSVQKSGGIHLNLLVIFRFSGWFQAKAEEETSCQEYSDFPPSP
jgi:hypothetical protein